MYLKIHGIKYNMIASKKSTFQKIKLIWL